MPLTGTGAILANRIASDLGYADGVGITSYVGMYTAMTGWITANALILPGSFTAVGVAVTGVGKLTLPPTGLGEAMRVGAGSVDGPGQPYWRALGDSIIAHMLSNAVMLPTLFVANPTGGPVTGLGTISYSGAPLGPLMAAALGVGDGNNLSTWNTIGIDIVNHIKQNANILPLFTSPFGGGPLVGTGRII